MIRAALVPIVLTLSLVFGNEVGHTQAHKCTTEDGRTVYQQVPCDPHQSEGEEVELMPGPSAEQSRAAEDRLKQRRSEQARQRRLEEYQEERRRLVRERDSIDLSLDQTISELIENRRRHRELNDRIQELDHAREDAIDPDGAAERAEQRRQTEMEDRLSDLERDQRRSRIEEILERNQPTILRNCRESLPGTIRCDP